MPNHSYHTGQDTLSYAEYGDPGGFPLLIQHGMIASIRDHVLFERLMAAGARLICMARPGYGESSPHPLKNMAEWGQITASLVDALDLPRVDVLGLSSGAPYSYAIGHQLPGKVRNLYIFSGTPALYDKGIQSHWPYPLNRDSDLAEMQALARQLFFSNLSEADKTQDDVRDSMMHESFGIAQDLMIRAQDWGFELPAVRAAVWMRHSRGDPSVPCVTAQMTAALLPHCQLEIVETDVHFSQAALDDFIRQTIIPNDKK